jgi:hypothetical protein
MTGSENEKERDRRDGELNNGELNNHDERNNSDDDKDLRARFMALRMEEETQTPEFTLSSMRRQLPARRLATVFARFGVVAVCLAAILVAVLWLRSGAPRRQPSQVASVIAWRSPTDFLLETPGQGLLQTVPAIGEWHDYSKVAEPGAMHSKVKK